MVRLVCLVQITVPKPPAIVALLPIFLNTSHSPDSVDVTRNEHHHTDHWSCKPGQKQVITVDQLLYTTVKKYNWPGQKNMMKRVIIVGHRIEMPCHR